MAEHEGPEANALPLPTVDEDAGVPLLEVQQRRAEADSRVAGHGVEDIAFDSDGVQRVITRLQDVRDKLSDHRKDAWRIANIEQRDEHASRMYATQANTGGERYLEALDEEISDLSELIEAAETVKEERVRFEHEAADELGRLG